MKKLFFTALFLIALPAALQAAPGKTKGEMGVWIGGTNPAPGTALAPLLDSNIGMGGFYRLNSPWFFFTELGFSYSYYNSRSSASATIVPLYAALDYKLPTPWKLEIFLKGGGGMSYIQIRPDNLEGWEPTSYAGFELSILATRSLRIGMRIDYTTIYERQLERPKQDDAITYWQLQQGYAPALIDYRYNTYDQFELHNASFAHFGVMMSFRL